MDLDRVAGAIGLELEADYAREAGRDLEARRPELLGLYGTGTVRWFKEEKASR